MAEVGSSESASETLLARSLVDLVESAIELILGPLCNKENDSQSYSSSHEMQDPSTREPLD
jgi:hypothetical protein